MVAKFEKIIYNKKHIGGIIMAISCEKLSLYCQNALTACGVSPDTLYLHGDLRLNTANTPAAARLLSLGLCDLILSPELTLPRMRDLRAALERAGHPAAAGAENH